MRRLLFLVVLMVFFWAGCGGKKSTPPSTTIAVTISPTTATLAAGAATQQFTATVTNTTNTAVTWNVDGTVGGNSVVGTITTTGLYTAPTTLPPGSTATTGTVTVNAVSQADATQIATATVTLTAPSVTISITPSSVTLPAGTTQQFTANVSGPTNTAVTWNVNGIAGGNAEFGTITDSGLYTAPASPPLGAINVNAISQANTVFSATATVSPQFGKLSLNGTYVFLAAQPDNASGTGFSARGGTFQADGNGNITAGIEDINTAPGAPVANASFTGTYTVGPDGRGTATISDGAGSPTFSFVLTSGSRGQIIESDGAAVTSGILRLQDQSAIGSVSGNYVFSLLGEGAAATASVGVMNLASGTVTGSIDSDTGGTISPTAALTGTDLLGSAGHGTLTLANGTFSFYIVDASMLALLEMDPGATRTSGIALAQSGTFSNSTLGTSVFAVSGTAVSGGGPYTEAGRFDTNAAGAFANGVFDQNNTGTSSNGASDSGTPFGTTATYSVDPTGRVQFSDGTSNFIVWLASAKQGLVMQADATAVATGYLFQQQGGFQQVSGGFDFVLAGANPTGPVPEAATGQLSTSGFGVLSGSADVAIAGAKPPTSTESVQGSLTIGSNGRGIGSIALGSSNSNYAFYFIDPNRLLLVSTNPNPPSPPPPPPPVFSGLAERQCSDCQ